MVMYSYNYNDDIIWLYYGYYGYYDVLLLRISYINLSLY